MIEVKSEEWNSLLEVIKSNYANGEVITHSLLKEWFGLEDPDIENYEDGQDFADAMQEQSFAYLQLMDALKKELLEEHQVCIRNIRGDGYVVVNPEDQTRFGYNEYIKQLKSETRRAKSIMTNVRPVSAEQQSKDNDLRAKHAALSQMLRGLKKAN